MADRNHSTPLDKAFAHKQGDRDLLYPLLTHVLSKLSPHARTHAPQPLALTSESQTNSGTFFFCITPQPRVE